MKVMQILYGGLGGHGSVFFSMVQADKKKQVSHEALFIGIEDLKPEYASLCMEKNIPYRFIKKKAGKHTKFFFRIFKAVRNTDADVIVVHGYLIFLPVWLAVRSGSRKIRIITVMHQPVQQMTKSDWLGLKLSLRFADKTVFLTEGYKAACENVLQKKLNTKTAVIPNGIDLSHFSPVRRQRSSPFRIGMQSRINALKDHKTLLEAFAIIRRRLPDIPMLLLIAGDGELKERLTADAERSGIGNEVIFTGMLSEEELPDFIRSLDLYTHCTHGEAMSTAIMQVMACRKPVIASDVNGVNNMISHEQNGLLFEASKPEALVEEIIRLKDDCELAETLADNAYQFATQHFGNDLMFQRYYKIFQHD